MNEYHKIQTLYKRDPATNMKTLLEGEYSLPEFEYLADNEWVFTEKVDGTNIRILWDGTEIRFRGKTDNSQIPALMVDHLNAHYLPLRDRFAEAFGAGPARLYGEGYGARIQKGGGNYRPDQGFVLFDVRVGDWWLRRDDVADIANRFGIDTVPIVGRGTLHQMVDRVILGANLFYAHQTLDAGAASAWGPFLAEGLVARPAVELFARNGDRLITKLKYKDFRPLPSQARSL